MSVSQKLSKTKSLESSKKEISNVSVSEKKKSSISQKKASITEKIVSTQSNTISKPSLDKIKPKACKPRPKPTPNLNSLRHQKPTKRTLDDFYKKQLQKEGLFDAVMGECCCSPGKEPSILVTGFGMRNWKSLEKAILSIKEPKDPRNKEELPESIFDEEEFTVLEETSESCETTSSTSQTETSSKSNISAKTLEYLLGLDTSAEEITDVPVSAHLTEAKEKTNYITGKTKAMRHAQIYLREHRVFEFFQYLIAFMLSKMPDNPIEFLLEHLDKLLLYRSELGVPPLLYEKIHIEQLFKVMDGMQTGFIDVKQFKEGMRTLGICSFDNYLIFQKEKLINKESFVALAYNSLTDILDDMIKDRSIKPYTTVTTLIQPPPSTVDLVSPSRFNISPSKLDLSTSKLDIFKGDSDSSSSCGSPTIVSPDFYLFSPKKKEYVETCVEAEPEAQNSNATIYTFDYFKSKHK